VRNVETTIGGALQGTKNAASGRRGSAANVKKTTKRTLVLIDFVNVVLFLIVLRSDNYSIDFRVSFVHIIQSNLLEETTGAQ
jgi:hypothetical protein